ncbi:MAG: Gfo/Idh/MocA family oxidoreductase [Bacteroidetes bacterium]|nr:Gfo/Idh/MocA family oxidoreductase [Bacteroidota bacterium]
MKKIRFAIIGYGNIGKRHAQHIIANDEAVLVAICELPSYAKPDDLSTTIAWYTDIEMMLKQEEIDVVNVCTPNYLHHAHCIQALQHKTHVVCEKPMAVSTIECDAMITSAKANERTIFVVKQNRYNEPVQQVKKLLERNALGSIFMVNVNCFWNRNAFYYNESEWRGKRKQDGGCLFTQFSHFVDILYYLFGDIKDCHGVIKNFNHPDIEIEDTGSFFMQTLSGAIVNFNFSTCSFEKNMEGAFTILGEKGTIKIGGQYLNTIEYQHIENEVLPDIKMSGKPNEYGKYQGSMSNHDKMIDNVIQTLHGKAQVMTNAFEGRTVVSMIERMYAGVR